MTGQIDPKDMYEQLCNDFRSLNGFLWQTPLIIMTLTGGLWFSVANFDLTEPARRSLLIFAVVADLLMIVALVRLRYVMEGVQKEIRALDGRSTLGPNYIIVGVFSILLGFAAVGSGLACVQPSAYFAKQPKAAAGMVLVAPKEQSVQPTAQPTPSPSPSMKPKP
jgi:hypothetical protein